MNKPSFSKYFNDRRDRANETFMSANGFADDFENFDDDFSFADDDFGYADGGGRSAAPTSQPYILNVQNTSTADISNVTILGAYSNIAAAAPAYGNATGISITMGISNVTYTEFLYQSMNKPFTVGLTYMSSTSSAQVLETLTVTTKDVNGNVASKVLTPTIDPYQQQNDKIAFKFNYTVDGFTYIIISRMLGATGGVSGNLKLYFYPAETVSPTRPLNGRKAVQGYGNPKVERPNTVKVIGQRNR